MVDRFFLPRDSDVAAGVVKLDRDESAHALGSRRLRTGDDVELIDGHGLIALGRVERADRDGCVVAILSVAHVERERPEVHLAVSVPRGPRMDDLVDGATQLGVATITPVVFERSVSARDDASPARQERWRRIAKEAAKQSGSAFVTSIGDVTPLATLLERAFAGRRLLLHPEPGAPQLASVLPDPTIATRLLVGPEGGLSPAEVERAKAEGEQVARLGGSLLRIELAALCACALARLR